ncbi:hypothetical protein [Metabacillus fastidiosus]|uniref:hypothetical protein n=1 Tax=Metabacillus fastidiosus TaxID=1458 RepID=UPI003D29B5D1
MKKWFLYVFLALVMLVGGCDMLRKTPETPAFQDEFTREFLVSKKEVEEGYYLFESKTGGYTMYFPTDAQQDEFFYEKNRDYYEIVKFRNFEDQDSASYYNKLIYENKKNTEDIKVNLNLLSSLTGYKGEYELIKGQKKDIYYAKFKENLDGTTFYLFIGYVKSKNSHQAVSFTYIIDCIKKNKNCEIDLPRNEEKVKKLMKSIEFQQ